MMNPDSWWFTVAVWLTLRGEGVPLFTPLPAAAPAVEDYSCPGCGCMPGDGLTPTCNHPDGCGYSRTYHDHEED